MKIYLTNCDKKRSHEFLFFVLEKFYGIKADETGLIRSEFGKLSLMDSGIYFNITHSGSLVAIGISTKDLGIDVEEIKPKDFSKMSTKYFGSLPQNEEEFYTLWTKAESFVKFKASSLIAELKKIDISGDEFIYDGAREQVLSKTIKFDNYVLSVTSSDLDIEVVKLEI